MKFSENWLRELVNPNIDTSTLLDQLTMAGLEVDGIEPAAPDFNKVVVAEVTALIPHPDADKLRIATVAIGQDAPIQIVCGAANVRVGLKTAAALIGAVLPGNFKIKKSKLRGVESFGMLCSKQELGLDTEADGLLELPNNVTIGQDFRETLKLNDHIIEVDLTPNRGDCLSITGIAREIGVINRQDVQQRNVQKATVSSDKTVAVSVENTEACPIYLGRVIDNINPNANTPLWMQEKLRRGGIRSLGPLVDVTNYVMLELGQPMHAFDLAQIEGKITVRNAKPDETLTLLDDKVITLTPDSLIIADEQKALALAGVMGGKASGISSNTQALFLECAFFEPVNLAGVARHYGMHTDASHRFERGVDTGLQTKAMERATELLLDIVGGDAGAISTVNHFEAKPTPILLVKTNIERLLGVSFDNHDITDILERLGMDITAQGTDTWLVTPPSFRFDVTIEADLIEELGRIYGYNNIPNRAITIPTHLPAQHEAHRELLTIKQFFVARDYQEAISYAFVNPKTQEILGIAEGAQDLANPISGDLAQMRTSLWAGLLPAVAYNLKRQHKRIRLFETGLRFFNNADQVLQQIPSLAGVICGDRTDSQWNSNSESVDFFDLKQDLTALLGDSITFEVGSHPALHPKQTAQINHQGKQCGLIGKIHPQVASSLKIPKQTYLFEIDLAIVQQQKVPNFAILSKFPEVKRDLAIVLDEKINAAHVVREIKAIGDMLLTDVAIFDLYTGENINQGQQSLALSLSFQHHDRTLTDEDIEQSMQGITQHLGQTFNAQLRD